MRINGAIARRLYRLLDKWFYKLEYAEVDVFDLASRIGMQKYKYPSKVLEKLQPAFDELVRHKFLESYKVIKKGQFTRIVSLHAIMYQDFAANMHHDFAANMYQSFAAKVYQ